jgi:hypothetical protein
MRHGFGPIPPAITVTPVSASTAGQLRFDNHVLEGDVDGNGTADFQVHVNVATLHSNDFIL